VQLDVPLAPPDAFALDPAVVHLNHGSFGACPRAVLAEQTRLRARVEAATMRYFVCEWQGDVDRARARVAGWLGGDPDGFVFVPNTTTAVSAVLGSLSFGPGDELLCTDHTYKACRNALERTARRTGASVVTAAIPWPIADAADATRAILDAVTPRTRLALVDHISSATALVFDLPAILAGLAARGVDAIVDGAHAPGQVALDLRALGAAYYIGNGHKWLCGPKGCAFLHVRADRRAPIHPLVTSHGFASDYGPPNRFHAEHDWQGSHDPTAYLSLPAAIDTIGDFGGGNATDDGWDAVRARNHALALAARDLLADRLGAGTMAPASMIGAMAVVPISLPDGARALAIEKDLLLRGWEVPIIEGPRGQALVRVATHVYIRLDEVEGLAVALAASGIRGATP